MEKIYSVFVLFLFLVQVHSQSKLLHDGQNYSDYTKSVEDDVKNVLVTKELAGNSYDGNDTPPLHETEISLDPYVRKKGARQIKMMSLSDTKADEDFAVHRRIKRATSPGPGVPESTSFLLEALAPYDAAEPTFKIGSLIPYRLTISLPTQVTDVEIEIFSELHSSMPFFHISNVRFGSIGSNFGSFDYSNVQVDYRSLYYPCMYDYVIMKLGDIVNNVADVTSAAASNIEILFEALALKHEALTAGTSYRLSIGVIHSDAKLVSVAQDDLKYAVFTPAANVLSPTITLSGPDSLNIGATGVFTITAVLHDLYTNLTVDIYSPLHSVGVMQTERVSIASTGENYKHSLVCRETGNSSRYDYNAYGPLYRQNIGYVLNTGYHYNNPNDNLADNTITIQVAIKMLDHTINDTSPYTLGFALYWMSESSIEIIWVGQKEVTAVPYTDPIMPSSPSVAIFTSVDKVAYGGYFGFLVNISLPHDSLSDYFLEVAAGTDNTVPLRIEKFGVTRIGFNLPSFVNESKPNTTLQNSNGVTDYFNLDLGVISNTGQGQLAHDDVIQVTVLFNVVDDGPSFTDGESLTIITGLKHRVDTYWVGDTTIVLSNAAVDYTANQVPSMAFDNSMGEEADIYAGTAAVMDMELVLPAAVNYPDFIVEVQTPEVISGKTAFRVISMEILEIGNGLANKLLDNITYTGLNETAADNSIVYNAASINVKHLSSYRDFLYREELPLFNKIRIRTVVIARGLESIGLVDNTVYYIEATVTIGESFIYAARKGIRYHTDVLDFYTGSPIQPFQEIVLDERNPDSSIGVGSLVQYNVNVGIPYKTAATVYVKAYKAEAPLMVCSMEMTGVGDAVIDYLDPTYTGQNFMRDSNNRPQYSEITRPSVTSYKEGNYYGNETDSYVSFRFFIFVESTASVGSSYNFEGRIRIGSLAEVVTNSSLAITSATPTKIDARLPIVEINHLDNRTVMNEGGSEWFYVDLYTVPETSYKYKLSIYAAYDASMYGSLTMLQAFPVSLGVNMTCSDLLNLTQGAVSSSQDNLSGKHNLATVDLGFIPNVANKGTEIKEDANKVRVLTHIALGRESPIVVGNAVHVYTVLTINDAEELGVVDQAMTVVDDSDTTNTNEGQAPTLTISHTSDSSFFVGESAGYKAVVNVPIGAAYSNFSVVIESPMVDGEAYVRITNLTVVSAGANLEEAEIDNDITFENNLYSQQYSQKIYFGFLRNSESTQKNPYVTSDDAADNIIILNYNVMMLDHVNLKNGYSFELKPKILYGAASVVNGTGDTFLTVTASPTDSTEWDWTASVLTTAGAITRESVIEFSLSLAITTASKRFPDDIELNFRVPKYSQLESVYDNTGFNINFTEPTAIVESGLTFMWKRLRYDNTVSLKFKITLDPSNYLEPGLLTRFISIPVDFTYKQTNKDAPTTIDTKYSEMQILKVEVSIPEATDALGLADNTIILDCQISASDEAAGSEASQVRLNTGTGWATKAMGPPLYKNDYIQVDMGGLTRFTAVTVQQHSDGSRITQFNIMYSNSGHYWKYVQDSSDSPQLFTVSWPNTVAADTQVKVAIDNVFIARYIRILPLANVEGSYSMKTRLELHGIPWPYPTLRPTYTCPVVDGTLLPYNDRQWVAPKTSLDVFVCMKANQRELPYCSASNDFGITWFSMDDLVMNVLAYANGTVWGISRDRKYYVGSDDRGQTWQIVQEEQYTLAKQVDTTHVLAKEIPFSLTASLADNTDYFLESDSLHTWAVASDGIYTLPSTASNIGNKKFATTMRAQWGDDSWSGP